LLYRAFKSSEHVPAPVIAVVNFAGIVMNTALLLIDIQNDYFPGGRFPLPSMELAAAKGAELLNWARNKNLKVIHVRHEETDPETGFLIQNTHGANIHGTVIPISGEVVITKNFPNSFRETTLINELNGIGNIFIAGAMSNMCIDATARAAFDLGYTVTVVEDACAACELEFHGKSLPHSEVHGAFMAALASAYGKVLCTKNVMHES
jgi:nicotinamidase-related amidase